MHKTTIENLVGVHFVDNNWGKVENNKDLKDRGQIFGDLVIFLYSSSTIFNFW